MRGPLLGSLSFLRYLVASEALQCWSSLDVIEIFGLRTLPGWHAEPSLSTSIDVVYAVV